MACRGFRLFLFMVFCVSSGTGYCQGLLPAKLEGEVFLFEVAAADTSGNPDANTQYLMHFGRGAYVYQIIGSGRVMQGKYRYIRKLGKNGIEVGLLTSEEVFAGGEVSYEMILMPENESVGMYLFKQNAGPLKHRAKLNAGRFTRVTRLVDVGLKRRCDSLSDSDSENSE